MSNRKSSVGVARRVAQKPHVPYRADDLAVGKRTGVTVDRVDRKSDGMEPFQDVLDLMDRRSPPRAKNTGRRKKRVTSPTVDNPEDELDENGEMTMELTDSELQFRSERLPRCSSFL
jgi:centromere protein C